MTAIDPRYQALINADPLYSQYVTDSGAQSVSDKASRDAAMRRSLEEFGQVPDFSSAASSLGLSAADLAAIVTPQARGIAASNTAAGTSTVARLNQSYADAQRNVVNALASRGMMRSGDTGYALNRTNLANTQQNYDARKTLLDYLAGAQSGYTAAEKARQQGLYQSLTDAYGRVLAKYPNGLPAVAAAAAAKKPAAATTTPAAAATPAWVNPSTRVVTAPGAPPANYGPAGPGFSGGYTSPTSVSTTAIAPKKPYNPYGVQSGANIYR